MTSGIKTILYHVTDMAQAKSLYSTLLGMDPYVDDEYYVGFQVDGQEIGLVNTSIAHGKSGTIPYIHVDDIDATHRALLDAGAEELEPISDVGGGMRVASVKDADGNVIGLSQKAK